MTVIQMVMIVDAVLTFMIVVMITSPDMMMGFVFTGMAV